MSYNPSTNTQIPQLQVTEMPRIGGVLIDIAGYEKKIPKDVQNLEPVLELLSLHTRLLTEIHSRICTPWYKRLWQWFKAALD